MFRHFKTDRKRQSANGYMSFTVRITSELIVIARHKVWKKQGLDSKTLVVRGKLERLMQADT